MCALVDVARGRQESTYNAAYLRDGRGILLVYQPTRYRKYYQQYQLALHICLVQIILSCVGSAGPRESATAGRPGATSSS